MEGIVCWNMICLQVFQDLITNNFSLMGNYTQKNYRLLLQNSKVCEFYIQFQITHWKADILTL
jgi:hypothetical protein